MGKSALLSTVAILLSVAVQPARAQEKPLPAAPPAAPAHVSVLTTVTRNRVFGYTAWDDDFFYIAVQVNKPVVKAHNTAPYANPLEDDAVIFALQTDNDHKATKRTAHTFTVAISAAGSAQLFIGEGATPLFNGLADFNDRLAETAKIADTSQQEISRVALLAKALHSSVTPKGAPTGAVSNAPGYTVELAIPWGDLGGRPEAGARMGFEVAAQSVDPGAGSPAIQSLMPGVNIAADLANPSLWGSILFSNTPGVSSNGALVCPRVYANRPVVDGDLSNGEWNGMSSYEFGEVAAAGGSGTGKAGILARTIAARVHPEYHARPPRPAIPLPAMATAASTPPSRRPQKTPSLVFACYDYRYQADTRKAAPTERVMRTNGETSLALHPLDGTGPWFSYDRADWHRHRLLDLRRAGVDVLLPIYRGTLHDRQLSSTKGLLSLVSALTSLRDTGQDYPQVALYLDTVAVEESLGSRPDLRDPAIQGAIYGQIRDFYRAIPPTFRCAIPLDKENGQGIAYPVFLSDASAFQAIDKSFVAYARGRFAADFEGADLLVLGAGNFKDAALDGYFAVSPTGGFQMNGDGWISTGTVNIGQQGRLSQMTPEQAAARSRKVTDAYRSDWAAALAKRPNWILLPSWDDYAGGAAIAPTLEAGYSLADLTSIFTRLFMGADNLGVRLITHDAPARMVASGTYPVHVRVQNAGTGTWGGAGQAQVALGYRWLRGGSAVSEASTIPVKPTVLPGQCVDLTLPVTAFSENSAGGGEYVLEIGLTAHDRRAASAGWLAAETPGAILSVPVHIQAVGAPATGRWAAALVQCDLPATVESGGVYEVHATLRNDSDVAWRQADGARVTLRLTRTAPVGDGTIGDAATQESAVSTADATAELTKDVPPGEVAEVHMLVALQDADGKPLPAWDQEQTWTYNARWEVAAGGPKETSGPTVTTASAGPSNAPLRGALTEPALLGVVDFDFGVRFTADTTPSPLPAERRIPVRLSLENVGPQIWKHDDVRVGYHWYYQDGTELVWEDETTPIAQDVPPGGQVNDMLAWLTAPPYDGSYYLIWDLRVGDTWASTSSTVRCFDESVQLVQVNKGHLTFGDLTTGYNLDGVTDEDNLGDGDLTGRGDTFPAAQVPPFTNSEVTPVSMWLPSVATGPESPRRISFRWGPKDPKSMNFIACRGQHFELGKSSGECRVLHILAASTEKDALTNLKLIFQEPTSRSEDLYAFQVSPWDRPPLHGEETAFLCYGHNSRTGLQPGAVALYHYAIRIKEPRKLVALGFPNNPEIKIAAVTLEK